MEFADNNNVSISINVLFFYANKEFHSRISFNSNIIDYVIIRKRLDVIKTKDIIDRILDVLVYICEKLNEAQLIIIEQINHYKKDITFKEKDLVFLNNKNIVTNKPLQKLNDKIFGSFKVLFVIDFFYKLKLSEMMRIYNVFHFKLLNFIVINSLSSQKNSSSKVIIVKKKLKN